MKLRRRKCIPSCASHQRVDEDEPHWCGKKREDEAAWSHDSSHVISQLAQCFKITKTPLRFHYSCTTFVGSGYIGSASSAVYRSFFFVVLSGGAGWGMSNAMVGPRAWIGGFFTRSNKRFGSDKYLNYILTPIQEERLQRLQERLGVPFDETLVEHQEALQALWTAAFPNVELTGLISEQWKDMGWQGANPSTDFRGCGFLSLENLLYFARNYQVTFHRLLLKQRGKRAKWEYPFAVAGINVSYMLIQMLDLHSDKPKCLPGHNFVKLLAENEEAFDILYCVAFSMMDAQWLAMHASYMEFNEVLQVTRTQLERELSLEDVHRIQDLPAYNMLYH